MVSNVGFKRMVLMSHLASPLILVYYRCHVLLPVDIAQDSVARRSDPRLDPGWHPTWIVVRAGSVSSQHPNTSGQHYPADGLKGRLEIETLDSF